MTYLRFIVVQDEKQQLMRATVWMRLVSNYDYGLLLLYFNLSENTKRALKLINFSKLPDDAYYMLLIGCSNLSHLYCKLIG